MAVAGTIAAVTAAAKAKPSQTKAALTKAAQAQASRAKATQAKATQAKATNAILKKDRALVLKASALEATRILNAAKREARKVANAKKSTTPNGLPALDLHSVVTKGSSSSKRSVDNVETSEPVNTAGKRRKRAGTFGNIFRTDAWQPGNEVMVSTRGSKRNRETKHAKIVSIDDETRAKVRLVFIARIYLLERQET